HMRDGFDIREKHKNSIRHMFLSKFTVKNSINIETKAILRDYLDQYDESYLNEVKIEDLRKIHKTYMHKPDDLFLYAIYKFMDHIGRKEEIMNMLAKE